MLYVLFSAFVSKGRVKTEILLYILRFSEEKKWLILKLLQLLCIRTEVLKPKQNTRVNNKAIYLPNKNAYTVYTVHTTV